MNKIGILIGLGILLLLMLGNIYAEGEYRKSLDAIVSNDGNETIQMR